MNLRRRMSRVVKSGVAAGIESLLEFGDRAAVEAVVTATGLGCIADSEKFLDSLIANEERMLNPTPVHPVDVQHGRGADRPAARAALL